MIRIMQSLAESSLLIVFLCIPPLVFFMMVARRHSWARPDQKPLLRTGMAIGAAILAFNLGVSTFGAPRFQVAAISDGISLPTMLAFVFSWASLWCAIGLAVLAPRRRYKLAAARTV